MKTIIYYLPYLPLYLMTLAGVIIIIRSFISMFVKHGKVNQKSLKLAEVENNELYLTFNK